MRRLAPTLLAAACAAPPVPEKARAERVILYTETLTVMMSDGALCVSDRPGRATVWTGVMQGCPHALPVEVRGLPAGPREELAPGGARVLVAGQGWG